MALPAPKPNIDTCNVCSKLFPRTNMRLCSGCSLVEENRFQLVREFLVENDGSGIGDIARATGVSSIDVRKFMDGGRLIELNPNSQTCTCHGVGERCRTCRSQLTNTFRQMQQTMQQEHAERRPADKPRTPGIRAGSDDSDGVRTSYVRRIRRIGES